MKIVVTGANGQLGTCLQKKALQYPDIEWKFTGVDDLDITNIDALDSYFSNEKPDYLINAAAYTLVDKAETETEICDLINHKAVENLAKICTKYHTTLINVSTDYVFDGESNEAYTETDLCNPTSIYGKTKLNGELALAKYCEKHVNVRTSWLYSPYKSNFVKTMMRLFNEKEQLNIVADQYGQPTNALDLADALIKISLHPNPIFGTYHFSNIGKISWFDFAAKIAEISKSKCKLSPIATSQYPTPAQRPKNSTLDCTKMAQNFQIPLKDWEVSLNEVMLELKNQH